jgi:hypothetical protein
MTTEVWAQGEGEMQVEFCKVYEATKSSDK